MVSFSTGVNSFLSSCRSAPVLRFVLLFSHTPLSSSQGPARERINSGKRKMRGTVMELTTNNSLQKLILSTFFDKSKTLKQDDYHL